MRDIQSCDFIVAHHAKFELQWLKRCGVDLSTLKVYCTMLGQWVLNGNVKKSLKLEAVADSYGIFYGKSPYVSKLIGFGICPSTIPQNKLLEYCVRDVNLCQAVFVHQVHKLDHEHLLPLVLTRNLTCIVLADIEFNGMTLDKARVVTEYNKTLDEYNQLSQELNTLTGGINLGSSKQLAEFLYDTMGFAQLRDHKGNILTTDKGKKPRTDSATILKLKAITSEQQTFVKLYTRYNKLASLLQKNLNFFERVCKHIPDCTFKAQFNQGVTGTHRLSSSGRPQEFPGEAGPMSVQFQNLPREYKRLFWSGDEDYLLGEADGAALEFRVAADLGRDPVAYDEISTWVDVHKITAATLTKAGEPTDRQQAKASTFAPLYAGMGKTPAQKAYATFFKQKYKGISDTQREWAEKVVDTKQLRTPYGMVFYWPDCKMSRSGYIEYSTEIYNYPVQGLATAEIIPIALVHFWYRSKSYNSGIDIVNTIHDSIIAKFHKSKEQEYRALAQQALTTDVFNFLKSNYHYDFITPLGVGIKVSRNWGDTKEETKLNVWPDGRAEAKKED